MDESIAAMASAYLEDGYVKCAVLVLCSYDRPTVTDNRSFAELCRLHPPVPADRRPAPSLDTPPLQVSPAVVRAAKCKPVISEQLRWRARQLEASTRQGPASGSFG